MGAVMIVVTIIIKDEEIVAHYERHMKATLEWRGAGIEIYLMGKRNDIQYEQASNIAMNICLAHHIPVVSLRRQKSPAKKRANDTSSKRLF